MQDKPNPFASEGFGAIRVATPKLRHKETTARTWVLRVMLTSLPTQMPRHLLCLPPTILRR
jgi:hypothetical protein